VWCELLRAAPAPLLAVDPTGVVRLASGAALRLLDRRESDVVGQQLDAVLPAGSATQTSTVDGWSVVALANGWDAETLLVDLIRSQERERARIAAGVHDDSLQVITAAMLRLQQLRNRVHDPATLTVIGRLEESIALAADRLRRLIFDFRPPALERSGLAAALRDTLSRMRDDFGVEVRLTDELPAEPSLPTRLLLFRIAQEALANVGQHAHAGSVAVTLSARCGGYQVRIADDGVGLRRGRSLAAPGHLGVTLMRERAEFAGGWFQLDSVPGTGTRVTVWVPEGAALDALRGGGER
jgi:signal transduction histidine kinase